MDELLTLLAIFCVIASAGAVCAADNNSDDFQLSYADDMGGYDESQYDYGADADSQNQDDGGWAGSQYNESEEDHGWAGSQYNETLENAIGAGNATGNATSPVEANTTSANATAPHSMLATGNPILLLLGASAVVGGYAVLRKRQ